MNMLMNAGGLGEDVDGFDECIMVLMNVLVVCGECVDSFDECVGGLW